MQPLHRLTRLHHDRRDRAERELVAARREREQRSAERDRCRLALESYRAAMPARERALYSALYGQLVDRRRLDRLHEEVADLRKEEAALAEQLVLAEQALQQAEEMVVQKRQAYGRQVKRCERYDEIAAVIDRAAQAARDANEEQQLEEAVGRRPATWALS